MVITINDKNRKLYNDFFVEAYADAYKASLIMDKDGSPVYKFDKELFEKGKEAFSSLWEYYHYLPELAKYKPVYYTKLPLNIDMVVIDGNSREMTVPDQFKKCASIENDHLAESIMFSIDRYHDSQDLMSAETWIQWTAMNGEEKIERAVLINNDMKDIDYEENKIRFPWPLDSSVTQYPGTIKFAVVFFLRTDDGIIRYRYSTLPYEIKIAPALQKELSGNPLDVGGLFAAAVRSNDYGPGFYVPQVPSFTQHGLNLTEESNLDYSGNSTYGALTLKAQATVGDTGTLSYSWYHKLPKEESKIYFPCGENVNFALPKGTSLSEEEAEFISALCPEDTVSAGELSDKKPLEYSFGIVAEAYEVVKSINNFDKYYIKENDVYKNIKSSDITSKQLDNDEIYEKITTLKLPEDNVPVTGSYFVTAKNTIGKKYSTTDSNKTTLISPKEVKFSGNQNVVDIFFDENNEAILETNLETNPNENYSMILETSSDNSNFENVSEYCYSVVEPGETALKLNSNASVGWYRAEVSATRNRETLKGTSRTWRVLKPVTAPKLISLVDATIQGDNFVSVDVQPDGAEFMLMVGFDNDIKDITNYYDVNKFESDDWYCNWYSKKPDQEKELISTAKGSVITLSNIERNTQIICEFCNVLSDKIATSTLIFEID